MSILYHLGTKRKPVHQTLAWGMRAGRHAIPRHVNSPYSEDEYPTSIIKIAIKRNVLAQTSVMRFSDKYIFLATTRTQRVGQFVWSESALYESDLTKKCALLMLFRILIPHSMTASRLLWLMRVSRYVLAHRQIWVIHRSWCPSEVEQCGLCTEAGLVWRCWRSHLEVVLRITYVSLKRLLYLWKLTIVIG